MRKAINHLKKSDPVLRAIIERVGPCRMEFGEPVFHSLAEAIVYQQLNGKAAVTIFNRFAALAGKPVTPEGILKLTPENMRAVGLSKQKSSYLRYGRTCQSWRTRLHSPPGFDRRRSY